jgi:hypothetical protein
MPAVVKKKMAKERKSDTSQKHLRRVRRICAAMPEMTERLSHGEPTFFVRKKVFAMFANNHHYDGHIAVWIPAPPGLQAVLIQDAPETYFKPPYVGVRGWVGIELDCVSDEQLASHIREAWRLVAPKTLKTAGGAALPLGTGRPIQERN